MRAAVSVKRSVPDLAGGPLCLAQPVPRAPSPVTRMLWCLRPPRHLPAPPTPPAASRPARPVRAGAGVFGVETFLLPDGSVLLNEVAPRPHNSGHYTIEACPSSQVSRPPRPARHMPHNVYRQCRGRCTVASVQGCVSLAWPVPGPVPALHCTQQPWQPQRSGQQQHSHACPACASNPPPGLSAV